MTVSPRSFDPGLRRGLRQYRHFRSVRPCIRTGSPRVSVGLAVNFQVTILKVLVSYPNGWATLADIKRDVAILATSGREWSERTTRLAARVPDLEIFAQALVERVDGGWRITDAGRSALDLMERKPSAAELPQAQIPAPAPLPAIPSPETFVVAGPNRRRVQRRRRHRGPNGQRRTANAS